MTSDSETFDPENLTDEQQKTQAEHQENVFLKYNLDHIDREIVKYLLRDPGATNLEIAQLLNLSDAAISYRRRREVFQKALSEQLMGAPELFKKAQEMAIRRLMKIIQGTNDKLALEASKIFMLPLVQSQMPAQIAPPVEEVVIFKTRIGSTGAIIRESMMDGKEKREDIIEIEANDGDDGRDNHS